MRVLADRLLVKLAPSPFVSPGGILLHAEIAPAVVTLGKVVQAGPRVRDVRAGDVVTFAPTAGDPLDDYFPTPHVLLRETEIAAVIERETTV